MAGSPVFLLASLVFIAGGLLLIRILSRRSDRSYAPPKEDTVLDDYLDALSDFVPGVSVKYYDREDTIELNDGDRGRLYLGNMRQQVGELGRADQTAKIRDFVRMGVAGEDPDAETVRAGLTLRPRTIEEVSIRRVSMGDKFDPVMRPVGDLYLDMMCDLGVALRGVTQDLLKSAELTEGEAFDLAMDNLRALTPTTAEALWEEMEPGIWAMRTVDDYSAARMIALWPELPRPVQSIGTVHMPTQGTVLLIEDRDPDRQRRLLMLGEELAAVQRRFSTQLYEPGPDGFIALGEGPTEALAASIASFQAYEDQAGFMLHIFTDEGQQAFLPKPMTLDGEEAAPGIPRIGTVFIGDSTLLPHVDVLIVPNPSDPDTVHEVSWDDAARALGADRLVPYPGLFPVRYDLRDPVPDDVMETLRNSGTPRNLKDTPS